MEPTHPCKALVLHCIDFRFRRNLTEFLNSKFGDSYDLVSVAGGVKRLISDPPMGSGQVPPENNFVLEQLRISDRLHKPEVIVFIQHEDCGSYGGSKAFENSAKEQEFQNSELEKAETLLKQQFSQPVEKYLARLSGEMVSF